MGEASVLYLALEATLGAEPAESQAGAGESNAGWSTTALSLHTRMEMTRKEERRVGEVTRVPSSTSLVGGLSFVLNHPVRRGQGGSG